MARLKIVGVMGSGSTSHKHLTEGLGKWLATIGVHLLTGGGEGIMSSVSKAFYEAQNRKGLVIGVLPAGEEEINRPGYPNPWVELVIQTHLPSRGVLGLAKESRNHINILSSDIVVILPGGVGTQSELALTLYYGKPAIVYGRREEFRFHLPEMIESTDDFEVVKSFIYSYIK